MTTQVNNDSLSIITVIKNKIINIYAYSLERLVFHFKNFLNDGNALTFTVQDAHKNFACVRTILQDNLEIGDREKYIIVLHLRLYNGSDTRHSSTFKPGLHNIQCCREFCA